MAVTKPTVQQCRMFIVAVPLGEKPSIISYTTCDILPNSFRQADDPCSSSPNQSHLRFGCCDNNANTQLVAFLDLPLSKAALCGKRLSSSISNDSYIWYSCALDVAQNRRKPVYHNLTAGIHYKGMATQGWIAFAHHIVSLTSRSLALEEIRCGYVSRQSYLPKDERELECILKRALTCLVCETPGKILVNGYLEMYIQKQSHCKDMDWNTHSLCFYNCSPKLFHDMFHFPCANILSSLFLHWDPTKCLLEILRERGIHFDKVFILKAIEKARAYHMTEYVEVLKKSLQFVVYETTKDGVEQLWCKISKLDETLLNIGLNSSEESFFILQMLSRGYTVEQILKCFDSRMEMAICKYIAILESMQVIHRI